MGGAWQVSWADLVLFPVTITYSIINKYKAHKAKKQHERDLAADLEHRDAARRWKEWHQNRGQKGLERQTRASIEQKPIPVMPWKQTDDYENSDGGGNGEISAPPPPSPPISEETVGQRITRVERAIEAKWMKNGNVDGEVRDDSMNEGQASQKPSMVEV